MVFPLPLVRSLSVSCLLSAALALLPSAASAAGCVHKTALPPLGDGPVVKVSTIDQLHAAVDKLKDHTTVLLSPGRYPLRETLYIKHRNVTIRGDGDNCQATVLAGKGMENAEHGGVVHGIWSNAKNLTISNLTIRDVYQHGVIFNAGAQSPRISSVRLLDTGTQFIKSNPVDFAEGVDNGIVEYSEMIYTAGPPNTDHGGGGGYTNGVDVHAGSDWIIRHNRFENFHTPDSSQWWWNPAVLMWNGARGTVVDSNVFINVDRAISLGLTDRSKNPGRKSTDTDHRGGIILNNTVVYREGLFSWRRRADSDAAIIIWDSPGTKVVHNTVLGYGNISKSIEFRFDTTGAEAINNLVDARVGSRNSGTYLQSGNVSVVSDKMFAGPAEGDLHLLKDARVIDGSRFSDLAPKDMDGDARSAPKVEPGADELIPRPALLNRRIPG